MFQRFIAGAVIFAAVGVALGITSQEAADPDGLEQILFADDGSINTEPFAVIHLHIDSQSCTKTDI